MHYTISNEKLSQSIHRELIRLKDDNVVNRIWEKDYTVWSDSSDEISNRLGWLDSVWTTSNSMDEINDFVNSVIDDGFKNVILMGMGGSSLAPEVFRLIFGIKEGYLDLTVVDSTHPDFIIEVGNNIIINETLFLVSTKSGGTVETISFMKYFYNKTANEIGKENAGNHFAAITDPESGLEKIARELSFRKIFLNDPNIGGRYSALSLFGMVPAALVGVDLNVFLSKAKSIADECKDSAKNLSAELGVILGVSAMEGIDKVTFITSPQIKFFGSWAEQLIAESTGKKGKGILPVDFEEILPADFYSNDRIFVYFKLKNEGSNKIKIIELVKAGFPIITIELEDIYDLGKEYFRWEFATIVAGWVMGIQPFDQPNVESAKIVARKMMAEYKETGQLPDLIPNFTETNIKISGALISNNIKDVMTEFLGNCVEDKSYVAIQAFINPEEEPAKLIHEIRTIIQKKYKIATTVGYGPRFLHSTGQLHKGDSGNGLFIQIISEPDNDIPIPDNPGQDESSVSFGVLIKAQALGDREAMLANNRKVLTIDLGNNVGEGLKLINHALI